MDSSIQARTSIRRRWALVCLFLLAFLPRAIYPVSRPLQWYFRSGEFVQAVLRGDLTGTLLSEHPGVPVMWLSGAALWGWHGLQSLAGLDIPTPLETEGYAFADRLGVGVVPLALVVAAGILWGWHLLRRLFGEKEAWAGALLWSMDPFFLANSKALHLDATLSTLMLLSALWMLIYLFDEDTGRKALLLSAILGGLAVLTKVTALFLIPFLGLCLLVRWASSRHHHRSKRRSLGWACGALSLWLLIALATCFALWPSLWVQPRASLDLVIRQGILLHAGGPRDQPIFYRGTLGVRDPGPTFYRDVLLFRSTFLTLPCSLLGLVSIWLQRGADREQRKLLPSLLLACFAASYFVQMSLGGWKDSRYMLPVLLVVDLFAARGIVWLSEGLLRSKPGTTAVTAGLIGAQACVVLAAHPYYGTRYNALLGGARAAAQVFPLGEFGEGLDLAGQYVDDRSDGDDVTVATQFLANEMVAQHVQAPVYDVSQVGEDADYLVFGVQYTTRGKDYGRWGELWERTYKFREPAYTATLGGLPYAWVHRPDAEPTPNERVNARLGDAISLVGYRVGDRRVAPGGTLCLTLYWRGQAPVNAAYKVFTHVEDSAGGLVAQQDNAPVRGTRPTDGWTPGALIQDPYELEFPPDIKPGEYTISAGMYNPISMERLVALDAEGNHLLNSRVVLTTVQVAPRVPRWRWAISTLWTGAMAAATFYAYTRSRNENARGRLRRQQGNLEDQS